MRGDHRCEGTVIDIFDDNESEESDEDIEEMEVVV
jgi:hypothetical protein